MKHPVNDTVSEAERLAAIRDALEGEPADIEPARTPSWTT
jgi:hypothetical protein